MSDLMTSSEPTQEVAAPVVDTVETPTNDAPVVESATEQVAEAQEPVGAPEEYEFTAPEGFTYDSEVIGQFEEVAKELNMPQDQAQKILDKMQPALAQQQAKALEAASKQWESQAIADKEYGGDKLQENLGVAKGALDKFGTPELKDLITKSGLGNHPEVIRMFYRIGKQMGNDSIVTNGNTSSSASGHYGTNGRLAEALYNSNRS